MTLLGKLGGRNRRFLHEPQRLEYRDNPEHGLRLILTFKPATSFLVPLDKCMALARQGLASLTPLGGGDGERLGKRAMNLPMSEMLFCKRYKGIIVCSLGYEYLKVCVTIMTHIVNCVWHF